MGAKKITNIVGAVLSLSVIVGVSVWGYKLMVRDVSGLPVVRASEGSMRVQPDNPGGLQANHQGLAVNAVAASGAAAPTADQLMLAPKPVDLADEDASMGVLAALKLKPVPAVPEPTELAKEPVAAFREGAVDALVAELTQGVSPLEALGADVALADIAGLQIEVPEAEPEAIDPADLKPLTPIVTGPGVSRSLFPIARPAISIQAAANVAPAAMETALETTEANSVIELDVADMKPGTRLAQLGAYASADLARADWDRIALRFSDFMDSKSRVVQEATSGGRTFYRLRAAGFEDLSDARRFCSALVAENADCIPVTLR